MFCAEWENNHCRIMFWNNSLSLFAINAQKFVSMCCGWCWCYCYCHYYRQCCGCIQTHNEGKCTHSWTLARCYSFKNEIDIFRASINFHNLIYAKFNWQMPHARFLFVLLCLAFASHFPSSIWQTNFAFARSIYPRNLFKMLKNKIRKELRFFFLERRRQQFNISKLIVLNCCSTLIVHPINVKVHNLIV